MLATPHALVEGVIIAAYAIRASHAFIYLRGGEVVPVLRRLQTAVAEPTPPDISVATSSDRASTWTSSCTPAPAPTSAARRPHCSTRSKAAADSRVCARRSPPAVAGLYACPTVVNNVESIASVPSILLNGVDWFHAMGTEKSPPGSRCTRCPVMSPGPANTRRRSVSPCANFSITPVASAPGTGSSSGLPAGRRHRCSPLSNSTFPPSTTKGGSRPPVDARHQGPADLRRDDLRGARGAALVAVLQTRIVREMHALPRRHLVARADPRTPRGRHRNRGRSRQAARHLRQHPRARVLRPRGCRDQPPITSSIALFRDEYIAHLTHGGCPFDPRLSILTSGGAAHDRRQGCCSPEPPASRSTASRSPCRRALS